ncbi:MAG: leucine-rich repeat domain-containing protein [Bacteroidaceae bacterium]|nr:leucine-rich repeat domain-containing protein [Bacteroidaceae bacterium]
MDSRVKAKVDRLSTSVSNIRSALIDKGVDATGHGAEDFATDIANMPPTFDPDDYIFTVINENDEYKREYDYIGKGTIKLPDDKYGKKTRLVEVSIPKTVTSIGTRAFSGCSNLKHVNLQNIVSVNNYAFSGCFSLESIYAPNLTSIGDIIPYAQSPGDFQLTEFVAPKVTSLTGRTFFHDREHFYNLTYIDVRSATKIGKEACKRLPSLKDIKIDSAITIEDWAFVDCKKLVTDINLPNLTSLSGSAFQNTGISKVVNLGVITSISGSFDNCANLNFVRLPSTLTAINSFAFQRCGSSMTVICEAGTPPTYGSIAFTTSNVSVVYVPDDSVDAYKAASGWNSLASKIHPLSEYTGSD